MDWIQSLSKPQPNKSLFKKIDKFTLYDHNSTSTINEEDKTFTCLLHCKKMNRLYHTICQIEGDFKIGQISVSCWLLDDSHIIKGKWQHQKIQLTRFAFRYNQTSNQNIFIRTNPLTGQIVVTLCFLTGEAILEDQTKFKVFVTDLCHSVGEESEMIFNTMLEIIFGQQTNGPYLKSAVKMNPGYPRYMKIEKLLKKIKTLITTSSFYKIRSDISSAHKNRSYFKKMYLSQEKKLQYNYKVAQMALLYEPKFSKRYEEANPKPRQRGLHFITDYIELEQKNEIQFAKHLHEGYEKELKQSSVEVGPVSNVHHDEETGLYLLTIGDQVVKAIVAKLTAEEYQHQVKLLKKMDKKHPNMASHIIPSNLPNEAAHWLFYPQDYQLPLLVYLKRNGRTVSISTKLHIMSQVCSFVQYLHKKGIIYFIRLQNIFITRGVEVRIRGFHRAYQVVEWADSKKDKESQPRIVNLIMKQNQMVSFPYMFIRKKDMDNQKCDVMSLGVCLYRILMEKFPFFERQAAQLQQTWNQEDWLKMWTVQTEYFLYKGGELCKILGNLLLKCMQFEDLSFRPYVEWLLVILCEVRTSLNGLY